MSKIKIKDIPQNVFILGVVSFLTDVSSDMVYPLIPVFLTQYLGAGQTFVGLVEGVAESTAALFTLISGLWADKAKDRSKLVVFGYSISSLSRPFIAMAQSPLMVLFVRFCDRIGKGIRTSPRDALIADSVEHHVRGKAFGFHRSMDHAGAVVGPVLASLLLAYFVKDLRHLFWIAAIPGFFAVYLVFSRVKEVLPETRTRKEKLDWKIEDPRLKVYLVILFVFILSCSTDAFLLLRAKELGVETYLLPIIWMVFNMVKAMTTMPFGILSDKIGRRKTLLLGWLVYALVYMGFAYAKTATDAWFLFASYGLFYGLTEGAERAILADYSHTGHRGQAYGWYYFIVGLGALPASLLFGYLWQVYGSKQAFLISAGISISASILLFLFLMLAPSKKTPIPSTS